MNRSNFAASIPAAETLLNGYLDHFGLNEQPFSLVPNTAYFVALDHHQACLETLAYAIASKEGFCKVTGEVGTGKTLLCRKLLNVLEPDQFKTAFIPTPQLTPAELKRAVAKELGCNEAYSVKDHELIEILVHRLLDIAQSGKQVVLLIDEAQALPDSSLEEIRLLTNLETQNKKLLQIVLFGQQELDDKLNQPNFRQLKQRIAFSFQLDFMKGQSVSYYINRRLSKAGYQGEALFTDKAIRWITRSTLGTPRLVNVLCNKALLLAYGLGKKKVNHDLVLAAVHDTESLSVKPKWYWL